MNAYQQIALLLYKMLNAWDDSTARQAMDDKLRSNPLKVFVSHASEDRPAVRELYAKLKDEPGLAPWMDEAEIRPGHDWDSIIQASLNDAQIALVCLSPASVGKLGASSYFAREVAYILDKAEGDARGRVYAIPVILRECEPFGRIRRWQFVKLYEPDGYQQLSDALVAQAKNLNQITDFKQFKFL